LFTFSSLDIWITLKRKCRNDLFDIVVVEKLMLLRSWRHKIYVLTIWRWGRLINLEIEKGQN